MIYGSECTPALFTGLAPQIVYGGCDHDTTDFYNKASGTTTAGADPEPGKANFRQRPLLTVDEVVTPEVGNCTIFARYVEPAFATQIILTTRLTRLYEREDWQARFAALKQEEPLLLERGVSLQPPVSQHEQADSQSQHTLEEAALHVMEKAQAIDEQAGGAATQFTSLSKMRHRAK